MLSIVVDFVAIWHTFSQLSGWLATKLIITPTLLIYDDTEIVGASVFCVIGESHDLSLDAVAA